MRLPSNGSSFLSLLLVLSASPPIGATGLRVDVDQGGVARWEAPGTDSCGMDGRVWGSLDETCYYPVDFERPSSTVEIARWAGATMETAWLVVHEREFEAQDIEFPHDHFVHLSEADLARHHSEQAVVKPLFRRRSGPARFELELGAPAESLPSGGGFGAPRTFNGEPKNAHTGTDYAIPLGTPVLSVAEGEVVLVAEHFFSGLSVYVDHGDGLVSMLFHLSEADVAVGDTVERGAKVGEIGSTGRSTGPHLHLGLRWRGARIDPDVMLASPDSMPTVAAAP